MLSPLADWIVKNATASISGLILIAIVAVIGFLAYGRIQEKGGKKAEKTYAGMRKGSVATLGLLIGGIVASVAVGCLVWWSTSWLFGLLDLPPFTIYLQHAVGFIIGSLIAYYGVFLPGRLSKASDNRPVFDIKPGERAFLKIFGIPFGSFGPGWGWRIPYIMSYTIDATAAHESSDTERKEYLTKNGVELFIRSGATIQIYDLLLAQAISAGDIPGYLEARRLAAVRRYVAENLSMNVDEAFTSTDPEQQVAAFKSLIQIKGDISSNGPSVVLGYLNEEIGAYGFNATQFQFQEVQFRDSLEKKIQRVYDEIGEGPGLKKDIMNKSMMIESFMKEKAKLLGLTLETLPQDIKLDLHRRAEAFVLAVEGQGSYNFQDFGQQVPRGVLLNMPQAQTPTKGNSA